MSCAEAWKDLEIVKYRVKRWLDPEDTMRLIISLLEKVMGKPISEAVGNEAVNKALIMYAMACLGKRPRKEQVEELLRIVEEMYRRCS